MTRPKGPPTTHCGTAGGYRRHRRRGETPCADCRAGHARATRTARRRRRTMGKPATIRRPACGTNAGYSRHYYYGEPPCEDCRRARNVYQRGANRRSRARKKAAQ